MSLVNNSKDVWIRCRPEEGSASNWFPVTDCLSLVLLCCFLFGFFFSLSLFILQQTSSTSWYLDMSFYLDRWFFVLFPYGLFCFSFQWWTKSELAVLVLVMLTFSLLIDFLIVWWLGFILLALRKMGQIGGHHFHMCTLLLPFKVFLNTRNTLFFSLSRLTKPPLSVCIRLLKRWQYHRWSQMECGR